MIDIHKKQWRSAASCIRLFFAIGMLVVLLSAYYTTYRVITEVHSTKRGDFAVPFPAYFGLQGLNKDAIHVRVASLVFAPAHLVDKQFRPTEWTVSRWSWPQKASATSRVADETKSKSIQGEQ